MKKLRGVLIALLSVALILCGCERDRRSAEELLCEVCSSLSMPAGRIYLSGAEEGNENFLDIETAKALYGTDAESVLSLVEDFAIYVSAKASPCEAAVFRCYSASDTDTVAAICLERVDMIRILLKDIGAARLADGAQVAIRGDCVFLLIVEDHEAAKKAIRRVSG